MSDDQPFDERHGVVPKMPRENPVYDDELDPNDVGQAIEYLISRLPKGVEARRPFNRCLATVINELVRLREIPQPARQLSPEEFLDKVNATRLFSTDGYAPSYPTAYTYLRSRPNLFSPETGAHIAAVLDELERRDREAVPRDLLRPEPGLLYADPQGRFECKPADAAWREAAINAPEMYSLLELRVMSAHVATAFDNVTKVLNKKSQEAGR